jgi:transposase
MQATPASRIIVSAQQDYDVELLGPVQTDRHWQAQEKQGFDAGSFTMDWKKQVVYCPPRLAAVGFLPMTHAGIQRST